jgi:ribosome-binding protein aMBF1 (putative translation factor)
MEPAVKKEDPGGPVHPAYANLDIQNVSDPLWFVRLPDFLFSEFRDKRTRVQIGTIRIDSSVDPTRPKITIVFNRNAVNKVPYSSLPETFDVRTEPVAQANQYIFSHRADCGYVRLIGHVIGEAQITSSEIEKLAECRRIFERAGKPEKKSKIDTILKDIPRQEEVVSPSPTAWRMPKKKAIKDKRLKMSDKEVRMELVMAFRERPEWAVRELAERLNQPTDHIMRFIGELADYDQRARVYKIKPDRQIDDSESD